MPLGPRLLVLALISASLPALLHAQALPAASADPISTGFQLPTAAGSLQYSVSGIESLTSGYSGGSGWQTASGVSGNLAMITSSKAYPFSMIISGGKFFSTSDQPSTTYANLAVSQVINTHRWSAILTDTVAYLPSTPSVGLSGIPGTGDVGIAPVQTGLDQGQGLLTPYSTRVSNAVSANVSRRLTARLSASAGGNYMTLRFVGNSAGTGINSDAYSGNAGLSYTLDARSTLSGNYSYSTYTYTGSLSGFKSQTASVGYTHQLSRRLGMDVFVGPQWSTVSSDGTVLIPGLTNASGTATNLYFSGDLNYTTRTTNYSLSYSRGTNNGYGVVPGGRSDTLRFTASRTFDRVWSLSANAAYARTSSLQGTQTYSPNTFVAAGQASRALGRSTSLFASYTLEKQTNTGLGVGLFNVFSGSFQVASFGLTYSPKALHFGPR